MTDYMQVPLPWDQEIIKQIIPHREPMLFVTRIVYYEPDKIVGELDLTGEEWFFPGHFPGEPVMPGNFTVEAIAQIGAVAMLSRSENHGEVILLTQENGLRFRTPIIPPCTVTLTVEFQQFNRAAGRARGEAKVGNTVCVDVGEVSCLVPDKRLLNRIVRQTKTGGV